MIRKTIKIALAGLIYYSRILSIRKLFQNHKNNVNSAIILMYHRIMPLSTPPVTERSWIRFRSHPSIVVSPEMFEAQLKFLSSKFNIISLKELSDIINAKKMIPKRTVVITLDDGWRDNYIYAFPAIKKYNVAATIFIPTALVGSSNIFWAERLIDYFSRGGKISTEAFNKLTHSVPSHIFDLLRKLDAKENRRGSFDSAAELIESIKDLIPSVRNELLKIIFMDKPTNDPVDADSRIFLSWEEIEEMRAFNIDFGSHCVNHEILTKINIGQQIRELGESYKILSEKLSTHAICLAYPNGDYDSNIKNLAKRVGYTCAVTTQAGYISGDRDPFALARINVRDEFCRGIFGEFSKALFSCYMHQILPVNVPGVRFLRVQFSRHIHRLF